MPEPHALPPEIDQALARGWIVLTANQRAARTLRHAYDRQQQACGLPAWHPPAIFAWDTWLATLWRRLLLDGHASALLLNPTQEHAVWRAIVEADRAATASTLQPLDDLAELAASAWSLLHAWCVRTRLHSAADTADTRAFARWAAEFDRRATRNAYLTPAQLPETLRAAFTQSRLTPPTGLFLLGFDTKTPAQSALLEAVQTAGAEFEEPSPQNQSPGAPSIAASPRWVGSTTLTLIPTPDEHAELAACAHWLRAHLTEHPGSRLAVIVPDLEVDRPSIDRAFRHILAPELEDIAAPATTGPYEFSLGVPLDQPPLASTALDILRWATGPLPLERVSALLLSPHFAPHPAELLPRAEFDAFQLRRHPFLQPRIALEQLLTLAAHSKSSASLPILLQHLRALRPLFNKKGLATAERTHADWAATMHDLLEAAGWTARTGESSIEFQTRRRWEAALDELATLDFDGARVSFPTALAALERIAAQTLFAPESRHAPIQILGPLEAAGSAFDALWFLRAGDLSWPANPAPHPLLPWHLQRDLAMPGADPTHDAALARRITERIAAQAPIVVFSYAHQASDEGHQRPSPSLTSLDLTASTLPLKAPAPDPIALEALPDEALIPISPDRVLSGGASILQSQAACAFRAFAEKRLFSTALEGRDLGLDPRERGSLVHDVLERFWSTVETQAALKNLPPLERELLLTRSIDEALDTHTHAAGPGWNRAYLDTERRRLLNLLRPWLDYELTRSPFTVKSREETLKDVQIGPLRLNIRVDRVDTALLDGEPAGDILLDYKTGAALPADWLGERPDAPQLPLYAVVSASEQLAAVAFASVRPGTAMNINGYQACDGVLPKCTRLKTGSLDTQVDQWRTVLTALAEAFHAGDAQVAPKQYPSTCRYCEQRLLCRLDLTTLEADAIEDFLDENDTPDRPAEPTVEASRG